MRAVFRSTHTDSSASPFIRCVWKHGEQLAQTAHYQSAKPFSSLKSGQQVLSTLVGENPGKKGPRIGSLEGIHFAADLNLRQTWRR